MSTETADPHVLLEALAFTAARVCEAELPAFTDRLRMALSAPVDGEADTQRRLEAGRWLERSAPVLPALLQDCLLQSLLGGIRDAIGPVASEACEAGPYQALIIHLSQRLDQAYAGPLAILGMRVSQCIAPNTMPTAPHPFRAEIFVRAFAEAASKLEGGKDCLPALLEVQDPTVFFRLDAVYDALDSALMAHATLPDAEQGYWDDVPELTVAADPPDLQQWLSAGGDAGLSCARAGALLDDTFKRLENDARLAAPVRKVVAQLALMLRPVLQQDQAFFFDSRHPARCLLQAVFEAGLSCGQDIDMSNALFVALARIPERLRTQGNATGMAALAAALGRLTAQQAEADMSSLAAPIAEARRKEQDVESQRTASAHVAARVETGEVSDFVEVFLQKHWSRVLAYACRHSAARPGLQGKILAAMDTLIWSVKPKCGAAERRQLLDSLPPLLSQLNAWLNVIQWHGQERELFFAELATQHATAVRGPSVMSPRDQLGLRMAAVEKASVYQLDRREKEQQQASYAPFLRQVDGLQAGQWVELVRNDGTGVNCRTAWVSPGRSLFLFATARAKRVFPLSREELAQALSVRRASLVAPGAWVSQAMAAAWHAVTGNTALAEKLSRVDELRQESDT